MDSNGHDPLWSRFLQTSWNVQDEARKVRDESDKRLQKLVEKVTEIMNAIEVERRMRDDALRTLYTRAASLEKEIRANVDESKLPTRQTQGGKSNANPEPQTR